MAPLICSLFGRKFQQKETLNKLKNSAVIVRVNRINILFIGHNSGKKKQSPYPYTGCSYKSA